ncbi:response regulator transcription factor [Pseudonocardia sp.]|uniref:response regulator transcription factor n=1 Tax=Pseudonocardia sp. TaxID=60912 RepID=UPI002634ACA1|nr:response regulator transcription factor [Pseudonocardia sp.]
MDRTGTTNVIIADDHVMIRSALASLVDNEPDLSVVGECGRGDEAVAMVARLRPDVAVLDVEMPGVDGLEACRQITGRHPGCRCMILTALNKPGLLQLSLRAGALGFIVKYSPVGELLDAIRAVARGERAVDSTLAIAALASYEVRLTERELAVVELVAEGIPDLEIGRTLSLSGGTVRNYVSAVMAKVGARNRVDLVRIGRADGWLRSSS